MDFQRVPPHNHRCNAAERAIQTWKAHFIAILSATDPDFPLNAWDHLIPQCNLTLNHLRSPRQQPNLSAYACIHGNFDFNQTPLAIPGTKVILHETPAQRSCFAPHGIDGFYVGPSMEHYRCYKIFVPATQDTRDCLTVEWFPRTIPYPKVNQLEYLRQTADDLLHLLNPKNTSSFPSLEFGSPLKNAYIQIAKILNRTTANPTKDGHECRELHTSDPTDPPNASIPPMPALPSPPPTPPLFRRPPLSPRPLDFPITNEQRPPLMPSPASIPRVEPTETAPVPRVETTVTASAPPVPPQTTVTATPPPRRYPQRHRTQPSRYGFATTVLTAKAYDHHIAALSTTPTSLLVPEKLPSLHKLLKGPDQKIWSRSWANELGRLLPHGVGKSRPKSKRIEGTSTIFPIKKSQVPAGRKVTYANFVCNI